VPHPPRPKRPPQPHPAPRRRPAALRSPAVRRAAVPVATALLAAFGAAGCRDAVAPAPPTRPGPPAAARAAAARAAGAAAPSRSARATRRRLERAAAGLLYTSEADHPFDYVFLDAGARPPLTEAAFRAAAGVPADSAVERWALDDFFARHIERVDPADPAAVALVPRYRALKAALRSSVAGVRVFRVGRVVIRCYVVGVDARGAIVGLATTAVET
jgi:hypothetical protein